MTADDVKVTPTALVREVTGDVGVDAKSGEVRVTVVKKVDVNAGVMQNVGLALNDIDHC